MGQVAGLNLAGWQTMRDPQGRLVQMPRPFNCACGEPACYGTDGMWWCTFCWQKRQQLIR